MSASVTRDVVILGSGLAGLTVANVLGDRAVVVERDSRPGGLVRSQRMGDYWFDDVIHVLYFADARTEERIRALMGSTLQSVRPLAFVETAHGTARYPLQLHLSDLDTPTVRRCVREIADISFAPPSDPPRNFREVLLRSFGPTLCELFFFPYNEKMWKRPLDTLAPSGFQWNIACPNLDEVLEGATSPRFAAPYNAAGWYPRPASGARGMELLSKALAARVTDVRLSCRVTSIDPHRREVTAQSNGDVKRFGYETLCCSTLPLPQTVAACTNAPRELLDSCATLTRNRVLTVAFAIRGPRPHHSGWWRYYPDPDLIFTRLIFMHQFDPDSAPSEGWVLMAEITQRAEDPSDDDAIIVRARDDAQRAGAIPAGSEIIAERVLLIDPAYVVFTLENREIVERAKTFLRANDIEPLGRYGRWEYSSMGQVMRDSFAFAEEAQRRIAARRA